MQSLSLLLLLLSLLVLSSSSVSGYYYRYTNVNEYGMPKEYYETLKMSEYRGSK